MYVYFLMNDFNESYVVALTYENRCLNLSVIVIHLGHPNSRSLPATARLEASIYYHFALLMIFLETTTWQTTRT